MPSSELAVGTFAILGAIVGSAITQLGAIRIDSRRRVDAARDARRAAVDSFLLSARTCTQNVAAAQGAHGMAEAADREWRWGNRKLLSDRAMRMMDMATLDGLAVVPTHVVDGREV